MPTIRDKFKTAFRGESGSAAAASAGDGANDDAGKQEEKIAKYVELARLIFSKYRLEGKINITSGLDRPLVSTTQSVVLKMVNSDTDKGDDEDEVEQMQSLDLDDDDDLDNDDYGKLMQAAEEDKDVAAAAASESTEENLGRMQKAVLAMMKKQVKDLMKRALMYKDKPYMKDTELSSRSTVSGPFLGVYSLTVSFSAEVQALLASCDYRESKNKNNK